MDKNGAQVYRTQQVLTASPAQLVAMLYDKAIASLKEAIAAIEAGDIERRWKANARTQEIISHLWMTLDKERGGEIAGNLERLFDFMMRKLPEVDFRNDPQPAREVISLLEPLHQSWRELAETGAGARALETMTAGGGQPQGPDKGDTGSEEPEPPRKSVSVSA